MDIKAPLTGTVWKVLVKEGDSVEDNEPVAILESMKMEIYVNAVFAGTIEKVACAVGDVVQADDLLLVVSD